MIGNSTSSGAPVCSHGTTIELSRSASRNTAGSTSPREACSRTSSSGFSGAKSLTASERPEQDRRDLLLAAHDVGQLDDAVLRLRAERLRRRGGVAGDDQPRALLHDVRDHQRVELVVVLVAGALGRLLELV